MYSVEDIQVQPWMSSLIRKSPDQSLFAAPRSISLLTTSFIAFVCLAIHRWLFVAWPLKTIAKNRLNCITQYYITVKEHGPVWMQTGHKICAMKNRNYLLRYCVYCVHWVIGFVGLNYFLHNNTINPITQSTQIVELRRIELLTLCLQSRCSPSWATAPNFLCLTKFWFREIWGSTNFHKF